MYEKPRVLEPPWPPPPPAVHELNVISKYLSVETIFIEYVSPEISEKLSPTASYKLVYVTLAKLVMSVAP